MVIYFISGLGADERIFEKLKLPGDFIIRHVHYIEPLSDETLFDYATRLSQQIDTTEDFILIGMSLGGMIAVEMNKFLSPKKTIIISSVSTNKEFPLQFLIIRMLDIQKITPAFLLKTPNPFAYWIFGVKTQREKMLLRSFMKNVTPHYLKWSVNAILNWNNKFRPQNLVHIHGTADHLLPDTYTNATIKIPGGGHLMVHNRHEEISRILIESIETAR